MLSARRTRVVSRCSAVTCARRFAAAATGGGAAASPLQQAEAKPQAAADAGSSAPATDPAVKVASTTTASAASSSERSDSTAATGSSSDSGKSGWGSGGRGGWWWRNVVPPAIGFSVGWGVWQVGEHLAPENMDRAARGLHHLAHLAQEWAVDTVLPTALTEALAERDWLMEPLGVSDRLLQEDAEGVPFRDIFRAVQMNEQLDWLEEHATEEIPFFYINELVGTWGAMQYAKHYFASPADVLSEADRAERDRLMQSVAAMRQEQAVALAGKPRYIVRRELEKLQLAHAAERDAKLTALERRRVLDPAAAARTAASVRQDLAAMKRRADFPAPGAVKVHSLAAPPSSATADELGEGLATATVPLAPLAGDAALLEGLYHRIVGTEQIRPAGGWAALAVLTRNPQNAVALATIALAAEQQQPPTAGPVRIDSAAAAGRAMDSLARAAAATPATTAEDLTLDEKQPPLLVEQSDAVAAAIQLASKQQGRPLSPPELEVESRWAAVAFDPVAVTLANVDSALRAEALGAGTRGSSGFSLLRPGTWFGGGNGIGPSAPWKDLATLPPAALAVGPFYAAAQVPELRERLARAWVEAAPPGTIRFVPAAEGAVGAAQVEACRRHMDRVLPTLRAWMTEPAAVATPGSAPVAPV